MPVEVQQQADGRVLVMRLNGKLKNDDYKQFGPVVDQAIQKQGKLRLLNEMHDFHGEAAAVLWEETKFGLKHYRDFERLALVGEKNWEEWLATLCKPFTIATVHYFPREQMTEAQVWVAAP